MNTPMNTPANPVLTGRSTPATELERGDGHSPPGPPVTVIPPWVIALERWVNEGGSGDDPDDAAWPNGASIPPHRQQR